MNIELKHPAIVSHGKHVKCIFEHMKNVYAISSNPLETWMDYIEKYADCLEIDEEDPIEKIEKRNEFVGDIFEILVEMLFKLSPIDNRYGLREYTVNEDLDMGVDAFGINVNGKKCVVQCKYRGRYHSNESKINIEDIGKTYMSGIELHGVDLYSPDNYRIFLITTAESKYISHNIEKICKKKVKVISKEHLEKLLNQENFWEIAYNLL